MLPWTFSALAKADLWSAARDMQGTLLHHSAPMEHSKVRVPTILTTPKIGGVPHHAVEQRTQWGHVLEHSRQVQCGGTLVGSGANNRHGPAGILISLHSIGPPFYLQRFEQSQLFFTSFL